MDSPITNTIANVAGRGVGALAALSSLGQAGGLSNYMFQRQRALAEPAIRATFADSPFAAGMFQVGGGTTPAGSVPVAAPSDFLQAGQAVAGPGSAWLPRLSPLAAETMLKVRGAQGVVHGLESTDPLVKAQSKLVAGVPLEPGELVGAVDAGRALQARAGAGSQVQLDIPGGRVAIGSPYLAGSYQTPGQATAAASAGGGVVVPDAQGGYKVVPLLEHEYIDKGQADAAGAAAGMVTVPTSRGTYMLQAPQRPLPPVDTVHPPATRGPATPPPAPAAPPAGAAGAAGPGPASTRTPTSGGPPPTIATRTNNPGNIKDGRFAQAQPGYVGSGPAAQDGGQFAVFETPAAGFAAQMALMRGPAYAGLTLDRGLRKWSNGGYGGEVAARAGIDPTRTVSSLSDAELGGVLTHQAAQEGFQFPAPAAPPAAQPLPERARVAPPGDSPTARVVAAPADMPGAAPPPPAPPAPAAAPPPPPAVVPIVPVSREISDEEAARFMQPPAAAPATGGPPPAIAYPSPAPPAPVVPMLTVPEIPLAPGPPPAVTLPPPPAAAPGVVQPPRDPQTQFPLQSFSRNSQAGTDTYAAPSGGDPEKVMLMADVGISDPRLTDAAQRRAYFQREMEFQAAHKATDADVARLRRGTTEGENEVSADYARLLARLNEFHEAFPTPEARAAYFKPGVRELFDTLPRLAPSGYTNFRTILSPFTALDTPKGEALPKHLAMLKPDAPTGNEPTADVFERRLQHFGDTLRLELAVRSAFQRLPVGEQTAAAYNALGENFVRERAAAREAALAPKLPEVLYNGPRPAGP